MTGSPAPRQYWNILKKKENQLSTICLQLKLKADDGNMREMELIFTMLSESATRSIAIREDAQGFNEKHDAALRGGAATGDARRSFEEKMGLKVVSNEIFLGLKEGDKTESIE